MNDLQKQEIILAYFKTIEKDNIVVCKILDIVKATCLTREQAAVTTAKLCKTGKLVKVAHMQYTFVKQTVNICKQITKRKTIDIDHIDDDYYFEQDYMLDKLED